MQPHATFTRLKSGDWGIRVIGPSAPSAGSTVTVTKRNGGAQEAKVLKVLWSGPGRNGEEAHLCTIVPKRAGARRTAKRHDGEPCGQECGARLVCNECGDWVNCGDGSRCWETGLIH